MLLASTGAQALNIISSNDDGWAEINIRTTYDALTSHNYSVIISAPAVDKSGTGSSEATPTVLSSACEFSSCAKGSPAEGYNATTPEWNYVNSYPATAMEYGIETLSPSWFGGSAPDLAVSGPNVGSNLGLTTAISGTVGAARKATNLGIPAVAFSGKTGSQTAWNVSPVPAYSTLYADAIATFVDALTAQSTEPFLPAGVFLNINFPSAGSGQSCTSADDFQFVLSRVYSSSGGDVVTCDNGGKLPTESSVVGTSGCYSSVSIMQASDLKDANQANQTTVLASLSSLLVCLP